MAELHIEIKTEDGLSIRLGREEAAELYEMLAGIFGSPQPVFVPYVPTFPGPYEVTCSTEFEED